MIIWTILNQEAPLGLIMVPLVTENGPWSHWGVMNLRKHVMFLTSIPLYECFYALQKGMFKIMPDCIPLACFHVPNKEFFQNLAWTLWAPIGFTTVSIEVLEWFWYSWFHRVPPLDFKLKVMDDSLKKSKGGGPHEIMKIKIITDLWTSILSV